MAWTRGRSQPNSGVRRDAGEAKQTLLGELGQFADDVDLLLAFVRLEELDLVLELCFLLDGKTGVVWDTVVVLSKKYNEYLVGLNMPRDTYLARKQATSERREDHGAEVVLAIEGTVTRSQDGVAKYGSNVTYANSRSG